MKRSCHLPRTINQILFSLLLLSIFSCGQEKSEADLRITRLDSNLARKYAQAIDSSLKPELAAGLELKIWAVDTLVGTPIAIDIDDVGKLYYTYTNRQKNSEFDIRGHKDWEIESIQLQTVEDKRAFLHRTLSPENSDKNKWLKDLNGDSSHDWKDMTIEKENIFRLEDTNGDGIADLSQLVVEDFHDEVTDVAGGVFSYGDDLYVAVAPDLWRMKDKNNDGIADDKTSISHGYGIHVGFGGHGMSGIEMGPDGRIYWQIGDIGFNGKGQDGQEWNNANNGVIARSNPDGSDFEIFAGGLRNTHEFVFDEYGNLISEDNDGDHAGEKERLVYIVNGSDAGWRTNWQFGKYRDPNNNTYKVWMAEKMYLPRFEGQAAYITPCIQNYVSGPAGMIYNPGTALNSKYKNTFFIAEFVGNPARSGIHAFKLKPKGASFEMSETTKILSGVLPTGLDFGPDGAMYVADWIDGWDTRNHGRIWKLDDTQGAKDPVRQETKRLLATDFRTLRANQLSDLLKNADMRVRQKAQFELVKRNEGPEVFKAMLAQKSNQLTRIHAIWGISQLARKEKSNAQALLPYLNDSDPEIRAQVAKWLGDVRYAEAGNQVIPLLKDQSIRVRFFAAEALGRMKYAAAVNPIISLLEANNDEDAYIRHAGSLALSRIGNADAVLALSNHPSKALRIAAVVALRRMRHAGIARFLKDQDEFIVTETARAINDDHSIVPALPALADVLKNTKFTNEALIRRAINANLRVGTDAALQNLIDYAVKPGTPVNMRAEAIDALSTWARPSVVDRVDGRYRGVIERDPAPVRSRVEGSLTGLLRSSDVPVRKSAVKAISRLEIKSASPQLFALLKSDPNPEVRIASLVAIADMKDPQVGNAIKQSVSDKDRSVRIVGLGLVDKTGMPNEMIVSLLSDVINTKTTEEKQAAILTLGKIPVNDSRKVFDQLLNNLETNKLPADIRLELAEAIDSTKSTELINRYKSISAKSAPDEMLAAYSGSLYGGDPDKGERIFYSNQTSQCIRCHAYGDVGGNAGPRLNGVGGRLTRPQLLESLINPSARIAPGFGIVTVTLKDGKTVAGTLVAETATTLSIKSGDDAPQSVAKSDVTKRIDGSSSMPDMKTILSKKEIRDVVSFLAESKADD